MKKSGNNFPGCDIVDDELSELDIELMAYDEVYVSPAEEKTEDD